MPTHKWAFGDRSGANLNGDAVIVFGERFDLNNGNNFVDNDIGLLEIKANEIVAITFRK